MESTKSMSGWLHSLIVGMAGPFHHDVRRDTQGQGIDDEGAVAGVGAD